MWLLVLLVIKKFKISREAIQMFPVNVICQYVKALTLPINYLVHILDGTINLPPFVTPFTPLSCVEFLCYLQQVSKMEA